MKDLLTLNHIDNIFIAKCKVKQIAGGPVMALIGFLHPIAMLVYEEIGDNLTRDQQLYLAEKIIIDKEKGIGFFPGMASKEFYGHIFNQGRKLSGWYSPGTYHNKFLCVVRYYEDSQNNFLIKVFTPNELELA